MVKALGYLVRVDRVRICEVLLVAGLYKKDYALSCRWEVILHQNNSYGLQLFHLKVGLHPPIPQAIMIVGFVVTKLQQKDRGK
jgi:hypothetical protein